MTWHPLDTWIITIGVLCAMACALPGCFLVLRRMSMMGDAISHAVLPGLVIGFIVTESRASWVMFIGAAVVGVLTAVFTQWVHSFGKVDRGAAMGVVFTTLFAVGLILLRGGGADHVDLDPGCVLYGAIEFAPLDRWNIAGLALPRAAVVLGSVLLINGLIVALFFKELKISSFDPALATTLGINARAMHYLLMTMTAVTTVASFESIGSILVIAMLIVPAAAAHLLTDRLGSMIGVALLFAAVSAALGHLAALTLPPLIGFDDTTTASMMATVAGGLFLLVMLAAPRHGVLSKLYHRASLSLRIVSEDVLGLLYRMEELRVAGAVAGPEQSRRESAKPRPDVFLRQALGVGPILSRVALARLSRAGQVTRTGGGGVAGGGGGEYRLTDSGRRAAANLVRTHRLWETFLSKHIVVPTDHLHAPAERLEHVTSAAMQQRLADASEHPAYDPQGKRVPGSEDRE